MNFKELQERLEQGDKMAPQELRDKVCQSSEEEVRDWVRGTLPLWETSSEVWDFDDAPEEGRFASKIGNLVWDALMEESKKPLIAYALGLMCWEGGEQYADENGNVEARYIRWYEESYNHFKDAKGIAHARHLMGLQWQEELGRSFNAQGMARYYGEAAALGYKDAFDELWLMYENYCCNDEDDKDYDLYDEIQDAMSDVLRSGREEVVSWFREKAEGGSERVVKLLKYKCWKRLSPCTLAMRCLLELAEAGHEDAQKALFFNGLLEWEWGGEDEYSNVIQYLCKAADSGSEWGKKTYNSLITLYLDYGEEGILLSEDVTADGDIGMLLAALKGDPEAVRLLLDKGADVQAQNKYGWTALMYAAEKGDTEAVRLLLDKGADVQAKITRGWRNGKTALDLADNEEIRALLRAAGAEE